MRYNKDLDKVIMYLTKHIENYTDREIEYIIHNYINESDNKCPTDILRQIYNEVGVVKDKYNIYLAFIDILEKHFNIDSNILEVGGGVIPSLSKLISLRQEAGTICVYDPRLTRINNSNLVLKKEKFSKNTDVSDYELLIGFMPCEATEVMIDSAIDNNKDFLIALCDGVHSAFDDYNNYIVWHKSIITSTKMKLNKLNKDIGVTNLLKYNDPYPVIYSKSKML